MSEVKDNRWKQWWQKLKNVYRFQVVEEKTYDVKFVLELNRLNVITVSGILIAILTLLNFLFIAYTPLKQYIPGYGTVDSRKEIIDLKLKTEAVEDKIEANEKYNKNLKNILTDKIEVKSLDENISPVIVDPDVLVQISPDEHKLIKDIEKGLTNAELYDNLQYKKTSNTLAALKAVPPINASIVSKFKNSKNAFTTIYKTPNASAIIATIDGYIVSIDEQKNGDFTVIIQHQGDLVSKYRNIKQVSKKSTNFVESGEEIGTADTQNNLEYELWYKGIPINVEKYYKK